eukprot:479847-Pyramimonas_sp.AAC.1
MNIYHAGPLPPGGADGAEVKLYNLHPWLTSGALGPASLPDPRRGWVLDRGGDSAPGTLQEEAERELRQPVIRFDLERVTRRQIGQPEYVGGAP